MANVIIFTDTPPRNLGLNDHPYYLRYQTRTAGAYAIASNLRNQGFSVKVIDHCASYTLKGIKKVIADNSQDLLWVGISTTFFFCNMSSDSTYRFEWKNSDDLSFNDILPLLSQQANLTKRNDFLNTKRELIWGSDEINLIAKFCDQIGVPLMIGGGWVSNIHDGNLTGLNGNVHIIAGRAEIVTSNITSSLAKGIPFVTIANNSSYDDNEFKHSTYHWDISDNISSDEWLPLEIARGCAFNCGFCSFDRRSKFDSYRTPDSIRTEILRNYEEFGVTKYILMDDLYNDSKEKVRAMYDNVWSKLPFKPEWASYMRLDMFWSDPESIEIVKESGARIGSFGIETLNSVAGKRVGKGLGKDRILDTLRLLKKSWGDQILVHGYFIAGLPGEPESSIIDTIDWTKNTELLDCVSWSPLWVTPPEHKKFVISTSPMSKDNDRYGIKWNKDGTWLNDQGITFEKATQLALRGNQSRDFFIGGFGDYPEYRQLGWTHRDIVNLKNKRLECTERLDLDSSKVLNNISRKIKKTLINDSK